MKVKLNLNPEHQGAKKPSHQPGDNLLCTLYRDNQPTKKPSGHDYFRLKDRQDNIKTENATNTKNCGNSYTTHYKNLEYKNM